MYEDYFADRLAELRTEKNVSAREMSLALGQNASYINRIENKKAFPSMQLFFYICEYLNITPKDFFATIEENEIKQKTELPQLLNQLTEAQLNLLSQFLNSFYDQKSVLRETN